MGFVPEINDLVSCILYLVEQHCKTNYLYIYKKHSILSQYDTKKNNFI